MNRAKFKEHVREMNDIYYSMDWIPEGKISYEFFNEENTMPESLKMRLINLIGELSA